MISYLSKFFKFQNAQEVKDLMDKVIALMNNTREWFLKGYTSLELRSDGKRTIPLSDMKINQAKKAGKVGRNELCPCGSGKKYKKCCGR